jgi:4-hydroxyphenylacetate 3-monooxygenase
MFYAGARFVTTGNSYRTFDWATARGLVDDLMSTDDLEVD